MLLSDLRAPGSNTGIQETKNYTFPAHHQVSPQKKAPAFWYLNPLGPCIMPAFPGFSAPD